MIACVIASFLVSWTPNHCLNFSIYLIGKNAIPAWMFYGNSVTQVIIYSFSKTLVYIFKKGLRQCLGNVESDHLCVYTRRSAQFGAEIN